MMLVETTGQQDIAGDAVFQPRNRLQPPTLLSSNRLRTAFLLLSLNITKRLNKEVEYTSIFISQLAPFRFSLLRLILTTNSFSVTRRVVSETCGRTNLTRTGVQHFGQTSPRSARALLLLQQSLSNAEQTRHKATRCWAGCLPELAGPLAVPGFTYSLVLMIWAAYSSETSVNSELPRRHIPSTECKAKS
jgi:hypothetical protein